MPSLNSKKLLDKAVEKWPAKALSVAAALILFVFHQMGTLETRVISTPLRLENAADFVPSGDYSRQIRVKLRGDPDGIKPILEEDIEAYIDLSKYSAEGRYSIPVQVRKKGTALGIEPLEISVDPMEVSLHLDKKIGKTLSLSARTRGDVAGGFELVSYMLAPAQVTAEGPLSILDPVTELFTEEIELEGRSESFTLTARIQNPNPLIRIRGSGSAEFRAVINQILPVMNIIGKPITLYALDERFTAVLDRDTGSIRLEGRQEILDQLDKGADFFSVDCSSIHETGTYPLKVAVNLPKGLTAAQWEPEEIRLTVELKGEEE